MNEWLPLYMNWSASPSTSRPNLGLICPPPWWLLRRSSAQHLLRVCNWNWGHTRKDPIGLPPRTALVGEGPERTRLVFDLARTPPPSPLPKPQPPPPPLKPSSSLATPPGFLAVVWSGGDNALRHPCRATPAPPAWKTITCSDARTGR